MENQFFIDSQYLSPACFGEKASTGNGPIQPQKPQEIFARYGNHRVGCMPSGHVADERF